MTADMKKEAERVLDNYLLHDGGCSKTIHERFKKSIGDEDELSFSYSELLTLVNEVQQDILAHLTAREHELMVIPGSNTAKQKYNCECESDTFCEGCLRRMGALAENRKTQEMLKEERE